MSTFVTTHQPLADAIAAVRPVDSDAMAEAGRRQDALAKPPGSLGQLETIGIQLAGIAGECPPPVPEPARVVVFAGDHGVHAQGVTPWPQEVTVAMVLGMLTGGASINVLAGQVGASVWVVDMGLKTPFDELPPLAPGVRFSTPRIAAGTADLSQGPALTPDQTLAAIQAGIDVGTAAVDDGARCLLIGEVGLGNTTPSAALIAAFTGATAADVTGRGAGCDDAQLAHKTDVVARALALHGLDQPGAAAADPLAALAAVGGLEQAGMVGLMLAGAKARVPVILDGVIACSAALVAVALCPNVAGYLVAGHTGVEPGILAAHDALGIRGLVDLELRLGEGTGAAMALPVVQAAARILNDVMLLPEV